MPAPTGHSWFGWWGWRPNGAWSPRAALTSRRLMVSACLTSDQPAPGPRPTMSTRPARFNGANVRLIWTGWLARLDAIAAEVSTAWPRRDASSSQHRACTAVVSSAFWLTTTLLALRRTCRGCQRRHPTLMCNKSCYRYGEGDGRQRQHRRPEVLGRRD